MGPPKINEKGSAREGGVLAALEVSSAVSSGCNIVIILVLFLLPVPTPLTTITGAPLQHSMQQPPIK